MEERQDLPWNAWGWRGKPRSSLGASGARHRQAVPQPHRLGRDSHDHSRLLAPPARTFHPDSLTQDSFELGACSPLQEPEKTASPVDVSTGKAKEISAGATLVFPEAR